MCDVVLLAAAAAGPASEPAAGIRAAAARQLSSQLYAQLPSDLATQALKVCVIADMHTPLALDLTGFCKANHACPCLHFIRGSC